MIHTVSCQMGGKTLSIETGKLAKQANGSVLVSYGDTRVLVTVCASKTPKEGIDFFPLTVEYAERFYAAGKIPGSFHRREGRPTSEATLSARMIDRPIRPLFPEGFRCETQIVATIISLDTEADPDIAAAAGASAALHISDIPFNGPTGACRIGRVGGKFVINPTWKMLQGESDLEIIVTGTERAIMMVEGGAHQVPEEEVLDAVLTAHREIKKITDMIEDLRKKCGKEKREFVPAAVDPAIEKGVEAASKQKIAQALKTKEKQQRYALMDEAKSAAIEALVPQSLVDSDSNKAKAKEKEVKAVFENLQYKMMREMILTERVRIDGRDEKTVRGITVEAGVLPRAHGSALFTRGETQVMSVITLGTSDDEQIVDSLYENTMRRVMLHYNFPPYSVGETGRMGGQSRREIGHGALAERGVQAILPKYDAFPYTLRIVCETLESNGSSSMGSVCSASMALMDAGVPVPKPVAGIAMGLIKENDRISILTDILGDEDHLGDMDFKVAGTRDGVTAIQMDIKIEGVDEAIMRKALAQAREGRLHILDKMAAAIEQPRQELSKYAPRIQTISIPTDRIGEVIGPSGKNIKAIIAATGCKIDINDDGKINIASNDSGAAEKAIKLIRDTIAEVEVGTIYKGIVKKVVEFGAFVGVLPNQDGLLHISEIAHERVNDVQDYLKEGDEVEVKVIDVDRMGKVRLSRKVLLPLPEGHVPPASHSGGGGRGPSGGGRGGPAGGGRPRAHN